MVVASCTPRTHEPIFRDTLRDAGLNPVPAGDGQHPRPVLLGPLGQARTGHRQGDRPGAHGRRPGRAARCRLQQETVPVNNAALVVGGGIAGMTAALALAEQGFPVHLVEKSDRAGRHGPPAPPHARRPRRAGVPGRDHRARRRASADHRPSAVARRQGRRPRGRLHLERSRPARRQPNEVKHGVVVVATGATEAEARTRSATARAPQVLTQLELSDRLGRGELELPEQATVAMIQCVEQRDEERPYCSRVCCTTAVKNALAMRERYPAGPDHGALSRHADLRLPRGGLPRGPGEGRAVRPLRAGAAAAAGTSTGELRLRVARAVAGPRPGAGAGPGRAGRADGAAGRPRRSCPSCCACR